MIKIKKYNELYKQQLLQLKITNQQKKFVSINISDLINDTKNNNLYLWVIIKNEQIIGVAAFLLDDDNDMNLLKYMIDSNFQGKGFGKEALKELIKLQKSFTPKNEVWLSVHPDNKTAISLYKRIGFTQQYTEYDADDEIFFKYLY